MLALRSVLTLVAAALAFGAAGAAILAHGGRFSARLDVLTHFAPLYLAPAFVALLLAGFAARPMRAPIALAALGAIVAVAALVGPEFLSRGTDPRAAANAPEQLKVIQFNAWGRNEKAREAVAWLLAQDPDIIVIEEGGRLRDMLLDAGFQSSCKSCSASVLARAKPVRSFAERRAGGRSSYVASATYADARGEFTVVAIHRFWPVRFARYAAQTRKLEALIAGLPKERLILAGDFNSTPWSFDRRREDVEFGLVRRTRALFSWPAAKISHNRLPAPFPYLPIDHVYAGPGWATVRVERGPELGSDHYPVVVTLAPVGSVAK
ncbi:MAG: endonuclease/exonuclease/phosphatase family protein [Phenylobacterium sp.]|uniref:endonuclease/exonuclease/phosphatase family protein n=1 Tax=Phenylobacterium sp. TaxID=1871053 RepID=UPI001A5DCB3F|nr:endonuclease/exonuclease/phosphatase family protein [Phenylobacterium sp.]MBL8556599.1 endonuclease/exonuclease/phosphatase family protein [Phenylobacterium sp.]